MLLQGGAAIPQVRRQHRGLSPINNAVYDNAPSPAARAATENRQMQAELKQLAGWENIFERNAIIPSLLVLFISFAITAVSIFLPTLAKTYNISNIGMFFTFQAVALGFSQFTIGKLSKWLGTTAVIIVSFIMLTISLLGIFFFRSLTILLALAVLYGMGMGFSMPTLNSLAVYKSPPNRRGKANATYYMAVDFGIGVGSAAWGVIADFSGIKWVFFFAAMIPLLTIFIFLAVQPKKVPVL